MDLLPDRTATTFTQWLKSHPGAEIIVRDRSTEYARGAALGAPAAIQVLDRWHVLRNVREVAERLLDRQAHELRELVVTEGAAEPIRRRSAAEEVRRAAVRQRMAERHAAIHRLAAAGGSILGIAQELHLTRTTVRRSLTATAPPERDYGRQASILDKHAAYLRQRWAEGCRNGLQLWRELCEQGYTGSPRQVSRWIAAQRTEPAPTTPQHRRPAEGTAAAPRRARRPSVPRLAWLLVRDAAGLADSDRALLQQLRGACTAAAIAYPLLQDIERIMKEKHPEQVAAWLDAAEQCAVRDLVTFAAGLRREREAFEAALRLPWSTGPVEGHNTRLKLVKRQGYGRASLQTLKHRFLRAA